MVLSVGSVSLGIWIDRTSRQVGGTGLTVRKQGSQTGWGSVAVGISFDDVQTLPEHVKMSQELLCRNCPIASSHT